MDDIKLKGIKMGRFLADLIGQYQQAEELLQEILSTIKDTYGTMSKETTEIYYTLFTVIRTHSMKSAFVTKNFQLKFRIPTCPFET